MFQVSTNNVKTGSHTLGHDTCFQNKIIQMCILHGYYTALSTNVNIYYYTLFQKPILKDASVTLIFILYGH
jgi:hypothetical protein